MTTINNTATARGKGNSFLNEAAVLPSIYFMQLANNDLFKHGSRCLPSPLAAQTSHYSFLSTALPNDTVTKGKYLISLFIY